jgi:hypothetical protein
VLPDVIEQRSPRIRLGFPKHLIRHVRRALRHWRGVVAPTVSPARRDPDPAETLTVAELWSAWRLADLDCWLELVAWRLAPLHLRADAFSDYRAALDREGWLAERLARRH